MIQPILLDTCAAIWISASAELRGNAEAALSEMDFAGGVLVSPITAWEIGTLTSKGRLVLNMAPVDWFNRLLEFGFSLAEMPAEVLVASAYLPPSNLRDPADRIMAATARHFRYRLMTRDQPLLDFAKAGHMSAVPC